MRYFGAIQGEYGIFKIGSLAVLAVLLTNGASVVTVLARA